MGLAFLTLLAMAAPAAAAKPRFHYFGVGDGPAGTDGRDGVVFLHDKPGIAYYESGLRVPEMRQISAPNCNGRQATFSGISWGHVLWSCYLDAPAFLVEDLASGTFSQVTDTTGRFLANAEYGYAGGIGKYWAVFGLTGYHWALTAYYNLVTRGWRLGPASAREIADPDVPGLVRRLCAPLRLAPNPDAAGPDSVDPYQGMAYEPPYGVTDEEVGSTKKGREIQRIVVQRCGSRKRVILSRCPHDCLDAEFSAGVVTWVDMRAFHAYVLRTHHGYSWPLHDFRRGVTLAFLSQTPHGLIASIGPPPGGRDWLIYTTSTVPK